jgi:type II secretory pathway pseudopilin PulG
MFAESMTEAQVNREGSASDLRYFHTTYGATFGYNERAKKYHRSYGLVTPPNQTAFVDTPAGPLATAPLYRRDHLGFRRDFPDEPATWSVGTSQLRKNNKQYGDDEPAAAAAAQVPALPRRTVQWQGSAAYADPEALGREAEERRQWERQQAAEDAYAAQRRARGWNGQEEEDPIPPPAPLPANGRAILTSSLSPARQKATGAGRSFGFGTTADPVTFEGGPDASSRRLPWATTSQANRHVLTDAEKTLMHEKANPNLYPTPAFKQSKFNPQFDAATHH